MNFTDLNLICWATFGLVWIVGSLYNFFNSPRTARHRARYDWLILGAVVWVVMHFLPHRYLDSARFHADWLQWIGTILLVASTLYTLWSRWILGRMWATNAAVKEGHQLVTKGPYQITRHPIYSGILGMVLGSTLSLGQGSSFFLFLIVLLFFINRIRNEEQLMVMTFGEEYIQYKERVPRLMPGFKLKSK